MTLLVYKQHEGGWKLINNRTYKTIKGAMEFAIMGSPKILESGTGNVNGFDYNWWIIDRDKQKWKVVDVEDFISTVLEEAWTPLEEA